MKCPSCNHVIVEHATACPVCNSQLSHAVTGPTQHLVPLSLSIRASTWRGWVIVALLAISGGSFPFLWADVAITGRIIIVIGWSIAILGVLAAMGLTRRRMLILSEHVLSERSLLGNEQVDMEQVGGLTLRITPTRYSVHYSLVLWNRSDQTIMVWDITYYTSKDLRQLIRAIMSRYPAVQVERELRQHLRLLNPIGE